MQRLRRKGCPLAHDVGWSCCQPHGAPPVTPGKFALHLRYYTELVSNVDEAPPLRLPCLPPVYSCCEPFIANHANI